MSSVSFAPSRSNRPTMAETYLLASKARYKLTKEAAHADHDLRVLVSHANLLDRLMDSLAIQREEQKLRAKKAQEMDGRMPVDIVSATSGITVHEDYSESDSDSDSDSENSDSEDDEYTYIYSDPQLDNSDMADELDSLSSDDDDFEDEIHQVEQVRIVPLDAYQSYLPTIQEEKDDYANQVMIAA